jgi:signal transduction histidine kinase
MREALDEMQAMLGDVIIELRRAIFALRPVDLETLGFYSTLEQLINDFSDQNQVAIHLQLFGQREDLPSGYELPLFRMVQEALSNIARHAASSSVLVTLTADVRSGVALSVCDNGRGFDPSLPDSAGQGGHFGLRQMRERVQRLNGRLEVCSAIGQGTQLAVILPPLAREESP